MTRHAKLGILTAITGLLFPFALAAADATITVTDDAGRLVAEHIPEKGVDFGRIDAGAKKTMTLGIANKTGRAIEIDGWRSPCECLDFEGIIESLAKDESKSVSLILDGTSFRGGISKYIYLSFNADNSEGTNLFLPVNFFVGETSGVPVGTSQPQDAASLLKSNAGVKKDASSAESEVVVKGVTIIDYKKSVDSKELAKAEAWIFAGNNCPGCNHLKSMLLPNLFEGRSVKVVMADLDKKENLLSLLKLEEKLGVDGKNSKTPVLYWRNRLIYGNDAVKALIECPGVQPQPLQDTEKLDISFLFENVDSNAETLAKRRAEQVTMGTVLAAGLVDGINPCAISTLVFLMSLLAVSKVGGVRLLLVGAVYCAAGFLTYLAIGLGLFSFLKAMEGFGLVRTIINWTMAVALVALSIISFRDAWRYKASGDSADVSLKLPDGIRARIHGVMRKGLALRFIVPAFFLVGVAVTVLESVCTGQVYLPTLALLAKTDSVERVRWLIPLIAYNLMFILPLVVVFLTVFLVGVKTEELLRLGRRSVVPGKVAMGLLFAGMAALMVWL